MRKILLPMLLFDETLLTALPMAKNCRSRSVLNKGNNY